MSSRGRCPKILRTCPFAQFVAVYVSRSIRVFRENSQKRFLPTFEANSMSLLSLISGVVAGVLRSELSSGSVNVIVPKTIWAFSAG